VEGGGVLSAALPDHGVLQRQGGCSAAAADAGRKPRRSGSCGLQPWPSCSLRLTYNHVAFVPLHVVLVLLL
jgi:hypothetical protein